ncbi:MAG: DMT family transporter [Desulfotomaculales bacterium]
MLLLGCAAAWALYTVWGKKALDRFSPLALTTFASGFGTLFLLAAAFSDLGRSPLWSLNPAGIWSLVFLGVLASGVANVFWYAGVRGVGAGRAAVFTNMVPFWSAVTAAVFLGEQLRLFHLAGAVLILGGVYLAMRKGHPQEGRCGDDGRCRRATPGYK